jgi:citrate lyase subunit beta/citryl-CoA lyase
VNNRRSFLFVPGNNERMLRKALSNELKPDCLILDLEDAVPYHQKQNARKLIVRILDDEGVKSSLLKEKGRKLISVRINQLDSDISTEDLHALTNTDLVTHLFIPKAESVSVRKISKEVSQRLFPIIESASGFIQMEEIARIDNIDGISYGAADMALSMRGAVTAYQNNEYIRTRVAVVGRAYGIDPIDQVFFDLVDHEGFKRKALEAKSLGYSGKLLIHPTQIEVVNQIFSSTTKEQKEWARRVVEAYGDAIERGSKGAIRLEGQLIDAVHYKLARDILANEEEG